MIGQLAADGKSILVSSHILTELAEMCDTVAIIEQGRLLAVGTVEEIHRAPADAATVALRVLESADGAGRLAGGAAATFTTCASDGDSVEFCTTAKRHTRPTCCATWCWPGFRVVAFGSRTKSLEDVFMQVTEGLVQ